MCQTPAVPGKNLSSTIYYLMLQIHETIGMLLCNSLGQLTLCMADFGRRQKRRPFFLLAARIPFILAAPSSSWHSRLALSCDLYEWEWLQFGGDRVSAA